MTTFSNENNSALNPAAGTLLASLGTPPLIPGHEYAITAYAIVVGTAGFADAFNIGLFVDGVQTDLLPIGGASESPQQPLRTVHITNNGSIQLKTINLGTSGVSYDTELVVEDVGTGSVPI